MNRSVAVEIIAFSPSDAEAIACAAADRIELCSAFALGGLTPTVGILAEVKARVALPVRAMLRPREAGMVYAPDEIAGMRRDMDALIDAGADGIVLCISRPDGSLDSEALAPFAAAARAVHRGLTCHRAFDLATDPLQALEVLIELGFDRVLTSGGAGSAPEGAERIAALVAAARGRIGILPGGGLRAHNVVGFVDRTGVHEVHLSANVMREDPSSAGSGLRFGAADGATYPVVDEAKVRDVVKALDR